MTYFVGQFVDLSFINKKPVSQKKSFSEASQTLFSVGTQIRFYFTPQGLETAIKIPVMAIA